jgi:hypothetical protein
MLFHSIENFYEPNDLGLVILNFMNLHFDKTYQSQETYYGSERMNAYPCYQTVTTKPDEENIFNPHTILKNTFERKTNKKIYVLKTFFRKTKLKELQESPSWNQHKPHTDGDDFDIAGIIYFNGSSLKDGTNFYLNKDHYEPTAVIAAQYNRCVFYGTQLPHCPSMVQQVEERWTQPFFLITKEETYKRYKESNGT